MTSSTPLWFLTLLVFMANTRSKLVSATNTQANPGCQRSHNWRPLNEWTRPQITGLESIQTNAPRPAAHIRAAVYVRYREETPERERDYLERVLLFGGWEHTNSYVSSSTPTRGTWIYTPTENSWFRLSMEEQPADRIGHSLTSVCRNTVVLYGGILNENIFSRRDFHQWTFRIRDLPRPVSRNEVWVFDGVREAWQNPTLSPAPIPRVFHSAVAFGSTNSSGCKTCHCRQSIFIFGGLTWSDSTNCSQVLDDLWELKFINKNKGILRWQQHQKTGETWPTGRFLHFAASTDDRTMIVFGGKLKTNGNSVNAADTYIVVWDELRLRVQKLSTSDDQQQPVSECVRSPDRYTADLVFDESQHRIMQIQNGTIYSFSIKYVDRSNNGYYSNYGYYSHSWIKDKTAIGKSAPTSLRDFAATMVNSTIVVFSGIVPQSTFRILAVWNVQMIENTWIWQLRPVPRNSPRLQDLASWNVIDDKLVFTSSTSHQWSRFLLHSWSRLTDSLASTTEIVIRVLHGSNSSVAFSAANRIRAFSKRMYTFYVGLNRSSNSVWQMDLNTSTWWQYSTASGYRPLFFTSSIGLLLNGSHTLVTYGGSAVSEFPDGDNQLTNTSLFSFALNRSDIFMYLLDRRVWIKPRRRGNVQPTPRLFPALAQGIDGRSVFLFGGLSLNVSTVEHVINGSRLKPSFLDLFTSGKYANCDNEVWKLTFLFTSLDEIEMRWDQLTTKICKGNKAPTGRLGHLALVVDNFLVIWGGTLTSARLSQNPNKLKLLECSKDLWILDISSGSYKWKRVLPEISIFDFWKLNSHMHCTAPVAIMGKRLVAAGTSNANSNSKRNSLGLWSVTINSSDVTPDDLHYLDYTIPFTPEYMFPWKSRILAVKQELGDDVISNGSELRLNLQYQDSVYLTEIEPVCLAGQFSREWSTIKCQECGIGHFAKEGAISCTKCPSGLTTSVTNASSSSYCMCDVDYCVHGHCLLVHGSEIKVECQCDFGFTGERCLMPTYFIIAGVSMPTFIIVLLALVLLKKMIKYRKQKADKEGALEKMDRVWSISCSEIHLYERIDDGAPGSYGHVYKARYRDMTVALKKLKLRTKEIEREFQRETELMKSMRHENIVLFLGAGRFEDDCPYLVVEYMQNGALSSILRNTEVELTSSQQHKFCLDAANGMEFLHSQRPPRIHRDLKSSNLLVSQSWVVKVADFGCARLVKKVGARFPVASRRSSPSLSLDEAMEPLLTVNGDLSDEVGAALWRAPEIFASEAYGTSADVYSFGIVMWEVVARQLPYIDKGYQRIREVKDAVLLGVRPTRPERSLRSYRDLMKECWSANPSHRPTFTEIVHRLQYISKNSEIEQPAHAERSC